MSQHDVLHLFESDTNTSIPVILCTFSTEFPDNVLRSSSYLCLFPRYFFLCSPVFNLLICSCVLLKSVFSPLLFFGLYVFCPVSVPQTSRVPCVPWFVPCGFAVLSNVLLALWAPRAEIHLVPLFHYTADTSETHAKFLEVKQVIFPKMLNHSTQTFCLMSDFKITTITEH